MNKTKPIYFSSRKEWRKWLEQNFNKEEEIWLLYPKKSSGKPRIIYNDAVEEALCFGWIDSTVKSIDNDNLAQRFTPRKPRSAFSQQNKERLKWLSDKKMLHPSVRDAVKEILDEKFVFPSDIVHAIRRDKRAWKNYTKFSDAYKRIRVAYIEGARKRPAEFNKRLANFIEKTRQNTLIGFGGIEKYY